MLAEYKAGIRSRVEGTEGGLRVEANNKIIAMLKQQDQHVAGRREALRQQHKFNLEKLQAELKLSLLELQKELRDQEQEVRQKTDAEFAKYADAADKALEQRMAEANTRANAELAELKATQTDLDEIRRLREAAQDLSRKTKEAERDLLDLRNNAEFLLSEYNSILMQIPPPEVPSPARHEQESDPEIEKLKQELCEKEKTRKKLEETLGPNQDHELEKRLVLDLNEIKQRLPAEVPLKKPNGACRTMMTAQAGEREEDVVAKLVVEADIQSLKMKEVFVSTYNEKLSLLKSQQTLLHDYASIAKLIEMLDYNDTAWREGLDSGRLEPSRRNVLERTRTKFDQQNRQLEYQMQVIQ